MSNKWAQTRGGSGAMGKSASAATLPLVPGVTRAMDPYLSRALNRRPKSAAPGSASSSSSAIPRMASSSLSSTAGAPMGSPINTNAGFRPPLNRPSTAHPSAESDRDVKPQVPMYVTREKQVLRFFAYFQEEVHEGGSMDTTGYRVRKFSIMYYLEDDTMSIEEPREANSGLSQGKFMRRGPVNKPKALGGGRYKPKDFQVGCELWIYGRRFRLVDADASTHSYFGQTDGLHALAAKEAYPEDGYKQERSRFEGNKGKVKQGPRREKGEYYKRDRRVLRFFCKYADDRLQGDKRDYVLYYYLLNDTVEIKEVAAEGRHNFPNLLRRQKLPKNSLHVPTGYGGVVSPRDPQKEHVQVVTWEDLRCGEAINVYGRHLLLMSCDSATAAWYAARGVHQKTLTVGHEEVEALHMEKIAPYNGYGNEDDLFAMGLSLEPMSREVNQEEYERFLKGDKKVLRFLAKLELPEGPDSVKQNREFVVNYFLADDSLSVFEPPVRNSGVIGGLFLARGRYKKYIPALGQAKEGTRASDVMEHCDGGLAEAMVGLGGELSRWVKATDFIPGSIVTFEMPRSGSKLFTLRITGYDEYTRKLLLQKEIFPQGASSLCMTRLAEVFSSSRLPVRSVMREQDKKGRGVLSAEHFKNLLRELEDMSERVPSKQKRGPICRLSDRDMALIITDFTDYEKSDDTSTMIQYDDFVDALVVASPAALKLKDRNRSLKVTDRILKVMTLAFEKEAAGGRLRQLFRARERLRRDGGSGANDTALEGAFGESSSSGGKGLRSAYVEAHVQKSDWINVLRQTNLNAIMTKQVAEALFLEHDTHGCGQLNYSSLCDEVFAGDFDHFKYADTFSSEGGSEAGQEEFDLGDEEGEGGEDCPETASQASGSGSDKGSASAMAMAASGVPPLGSLRQSGSGSGLQLRRRNSADLKEVERRLSNIPLQNNMSVPICLNMPSRPAKQKRYEKPPTVGSYLNKVNQNLFSHNGDISKQLAGAMRSFSSCFARANRKKMLRKHFLAFDVNNTGKISQEQFIETVNDVTAEFFVDFDSRHKDMLAAFFFPKRHCRTDYESLLEIITVRDIRRANAFHRALLAEGSDYGELFTGADDAARRRDFGGTLNLFEVR